jgi:pimeloyl-ACP methyl ester carboxylesterase
VTGSLNTASVNGVSIAYRDTGSGPAVVLIHGHPFDHTMWDGQTAALSGRYRVITPDLRGYGASEVPDNEVTTLETMADDVRVLLDHLRVERAVVVGLSMGGQVAMAFADLFPERLEGLVLTATSPDGETAEGAKARRAMAERFEREGSVLPGGEMLPRLLAVASVKRDPAIAVKVFTMIARTSPAGAAAALRGRALRKDYVEPLSRVAVPALVVAGTEDKYVSLETAKRMEECIPGARLEIFEGIGHLPNLEDPEHYNAVLESYLESLRR